jgi:hypothetical protein
MSKIANEDLVQKAVVTTNDIAAAGRLNAKQSDQFIDYVVDMSGLKNNARVVRVSTDWEIDKIGIGTRVAMPKAEATAPSLRRGVTTTKVTLTPKVIVVPFEISDEFREENIEGDNIEAHIIRMMAAQLSNDMEELFINGNTLGPAVLENTLREDGSSSLYVKDSYLALGDGWLKLAIAGGHIVNAGNVSVGPSLFSSMLKAMPAKFKRNLGDMRFITSQDLEQNYREKIATRQTASGESALNSLAPLAPFGVPLVPFPLFPFNATVTQHITGATDTDFNLGFAPIVDGSMVVTRQSLGNVATAAETITSSYLINYTTGVLHTESGLNTVPLKLTFQVGPQVMLANYKNFIIAIGRDITIEKDRDIYKGVNQYAITTKIACGFEEDDALVIARNIGSSV